MIGYHQNKGSLTDPIISHSGLLKLEEHPLIFAKYIEEDGDKKSTPSMQKGDLLHQWIEHKDSFVISEIDKPSGKPGELTEKLFSLLYNEGYKNNSHFLQFCQGNYNIDLESLSLYKDLFIAINKRVALDDELKLLVYAFRFARNEVEYGGNWKEPTVLKKFKDEAKGAEYFNFLETADGKIAMTVQEKDILTNCYESIRKHPLADKLLFEIEGQHEIELFWEQAINGITIKRKAKLDKVIVDYANKKLIIVDPKTTSDSFTNFFYSTDGAYIKYNYRRQLESYAGGWFMSNKIAPIDWTIELYNIVVQTIDPYPTIVKRTVVDKDNRVDIFLDDTLLRPAHHIKTGNWQITMEEYENGGYRSY